MSRGHDSGNNCGLSASGPGTAGLTWEQAEVAGMRESIWAYLEPRP
jgi:hypothetical protein